MKQVAIPCAGHSYAIAADWYEGTSDRVMLVLPGWTSSKKSYEELVRYIVERTGMSALIIDYSGHGESPLDAMEVRPAQQFLEAIEAFDWAGQRLPGAEFTVMGASYGGYLAAKLTEYRDFANLILRVPAIYEPVDFYSLNKDINRQDERGYRKGVAFLENHPLFMSASQFKGRTLVMWSEFDEFVPKEATDKYIEAFRADSYFAKGWKHSFKVDAPEAEKNAYRDAIVHWLVE